MLRETMKYIFISFASWLRNAGVWQTVHNYSTPSLFCETEVTNC